MLVLFSEFDPDGVSVIFRCVGFQLPETGRKAWAVEPNARRSHQKNPQFD